MAGGDVTGTLLFETRRELTTEISRQGTPPGKDAALDLFLQAGHLPRDLGEAPRRAGEGRAEVGLRAAQGLRIGRARCGEQCGPRRLLKLAAGVDDHDTLGDSRVHTSITVDPA